MYRPRKRVAGSQALNALNKHSARSLLQYFEKHEIIYIEIGSRRIRTHAQILVAGKCRYDEIIEANSVPYNRALTRI